MSDMFIYFLDLSIARPIYAETEPASGQEVERMYGCCGARSFLTREEKLEMLSDYQKSLESELKGVQERIKEIRKDN